ncbi:MAG: CHAT domain-containing protein [Pseudomonadota bacterium]
MIVHLILSASLASTPCNDAPPTDVSDTPAVFETIERCADQMTDENLLSWWIALDDAYHDADDIPEAARGARIMADQFDQRNWPLGRAKARQNLALASFWQGDYVAAEKAAVDGLKIASENGLEDAEVGILLKTDLMSVMRRTDRIDKALPIAEDLHAALPTANIDDEAKASIWAAISRVYRFSVLSNSKRLPDGEEPDYSLAYEAAKAATRAAISCCIEDQPNSVGGIMSSEAATLATWGRHEEAATRYAEAIELYERASSWDNRNLVLLETFHAQSLRAIGRSEDAASVMTSALSRAQSRFRTRLLSEGGLQPDDKTNIRYTTDQFLDLIWERYGRSAPPEVLDRAFQAVQLAASDELALAVRTRSLKEDPKAVALIEAWNETRHAIASLDRQFSRPQSSSDTRAFGDREVLTEKISGIERQLLSSGVNIEMLAEPLDAASLMAELKSGETYLQIFSVFGDITAFAITKDGVSWHRAAYEAREACEAVASLRRALTRAHRLVCDPNGEYIAATEGPLPAFDRTLAHDLYSRLLAPFGTVVSDAELLSVSATGPLSSLPITVLVTEPPKGEDTDTKALSSTAWLGAKTPIIVTATPRGAIRQAAKNRTVKSLVTFTPSGAAPRLDGAELEAQTLQENFFKIGVSIPDDMDQAARAILSGKQAPSGTLVAIPAHTAIDQSTNGEPSLLIAEDDNGHLSAGEISNLNLQKASWVILTGCNTAGTDGGPRPETLSGLATAFANAGARDLLLTHFEVEDGAAATFVSNIVREYSRGQKSKPKAVQGAIITALKSANATKHHPSAWAPFFLMYAE